jgi:hypothetical protein
MKFQEEKGLEIDGKVGPNTWSVLCGSTNTGPTTTGPTTTGPTTTGPTTTGPTTTGPTQPSNTGYVKCTTPQKDSASLQAFIMNPEASTLDLLSKNKCLEYRNLKWDYYDYYGGQGRKLKVPDKYGNTEEPRGPNEDKTSQMVAALKTVNPERRVTVEEGGVAPGTAVLCVKCNRADPHIIIENIGTSQKRTISPELWSWIQEQLVPVSGTGKQLNKHAAESFERMKVDAKQDGIDLVILPGQGAAFRSKTAADTGCAKAGNTFAVACFPNSHNLGLAVDLRMSHGGQKYEEATTLGTYGMQNVVDMHNSAVNKWLSVNAAKYNWYPFTHEPWHWEYNPPDFDDTFFAGAPG